MASNLRVDSIVPATGANVSIGTATGGVNIPGVLTYEDVTNVDSVGVITARTDINIGDSIIHIGDTNTKIRFPAADTITAETGGSERVRIASDGDVGIGTNAPVERLHLHKPSATGPFLYITNTSTGVSASDGIQIGFDGSNDVVLKNNEPTNLKFYTSASERLRITSEGYVTKPNTPTFSARGSVDAISAQSPLPFDTAEYNNGNHYSTTTYKFTCPVDGYYYVTCHCVPTNFTTPNNVELYVKDQSGNRYFLDRKVKSNNYSTNNFSVGGSRILYKNTGNTLWVEFNSINGSPTLEGSSHFGIMLMA